MITGCHSASVRCGGSLGDGDSVVIDPTIANDDKVNNVKLMAMPSKQHVAPWQGTRGLSGWSQAAEISSNGAATVNTCKGVVRFTGSFEAPIGS